MAVLNSFDPVKYKIAKAYSSGGEYKKSTLLAIDSSFNFAITIHFLSPLDKNTFIIPALLKLSKNLS